MVRASILDGCLVNNIILGYFFYTLIHAIVNVMEEACGIVARKIPESASRKQNYSNDAPKEYDPPKVIHVNYCQFNIIEVR